MTREFIDKFNRDDGPLGSDWTNACGEAAIFDEAVRPIDVSGSVNPTNPASPLEGLTSEKTQLFYEQQPLDVPDMVVRGVWGHDPVLPTGVVGDPSFTILARASKDPLLLDLGGEEEPLCFDQAYGLRVVCPLNEQNPTLKIIKLIPDKRINSSSQEPDNAVVLAEVQLRAQDLNVDPSFKLDEDNKNQTENVPYRGFWQDMRLRVRGGDDRVFLDAYINGRYEQTPILTYCDFQDPLWSIVGVPGMEFISPTFQDQPEGASPFDEAAKSVMACTLFSAQTVKHQDQPRSVLPSNRFTYGRVVDRVILLVEKNGDAKYSATAAGQTKRQTYLDFVLEAEADIVRKEGYYDWLLAEKRIYLVSGQEVYELPEDHGLTKLMIPGNWNGAPLQWLESTIFRHRVGTNTNTSGRPRIYTDAEVGPNDRRQVRFFPIPDTEAISLQEEGRDTDAYVQIEYYRRRLYPSDPDNQLPVVPQEHMDVLIYGAAAHALLLDTDPENSRTMAAIYNSKLKDLRRANNRMTTEQDVFRSAADVVTQVTTSRIPLLRATVLETLL